MTHLVAIPTSLGRSIALGTTGVVLATGNSVLQSFTVTNPGAAGAWIKLYDKATAPTQADTPVLTVFVAAGRSVVLPVASIGFSLGIGIRATTAAADGDTGAPLTAPIVNAMSRERVTGPVAVVTTTATTTTTAAPSYNYLISNDADWATVFANNDATLANKVIAVAPGTYTAKTLTTRNPSTVVTVRALDPLNKPNIDSLTLSAVNKFTFEDIGFVNTAWNSTPKGCVDFSGSCDSITFTRCAWRGNYRGTLSPDFNLLTDAIPEYACILPQFNASGNLSSLIIQRPYVGDLLADGTYSITFTALSGYSFSVTPVATFTVSAGNIVSTNITNTGSGTHTDSLNGNIGGLSKICTWSGQNRMIDYTVFGIRSSLSPVLSNITVQDSTFDFLGNAFKPSGVAGPITLARNTFTRVYQDYISVGCGQNNFTMNIVDNFTTTPFSKSGDPGDPHSDHLQFFMNDISVPYTPQDWSDVTIERNIHIDGATRGGIQGMIIADSPENIAFNRWRIVGNFVASKTLAMGMSLSTPRDCFIAHNAFINYDPTDPSNTSARYLTVSRTLDTPHAPGPFAYGTSLIRNNICEALNRGVLNNTTINDDGNVILGLGGVTIPYGNVFTDHTAARTTVAEIVAAYTPKVAYAGKGPFANTAYISHTGRTTDRTQEPSYVAWASLTGQTTNTLVTSGWSCLISGSNGRAISITNGEYRIANNASGTGASAWTSSPGTVDVGKFIQVRHTTSASGSAQVTSTVTIGGYSFTFVSTTASVASFTRVDNGGTAYSSFGRPTNETGLKKLLFVARFRIDGITTGANIVAHAAATALRFWFPTASTIRFQSILSSRCNLRPTITPATGHIRTHFISLDFGNTNASQGCYWATDVDGVILNNTPGSGGIFDTRSVAGTGVDYGAFSFDLTSTNTSIWTPSGNIGVFGEGDGGGVLFDGAFDFLWMDWGTSGYTLPDITNSAVRDAWLADNIGANGQGPTGSSPKIYYTGNAAGWNAGLSNLGSLSLPLTKGAGTYV